MLRRLKSTVKKYLDRYVQRVCRREFERQKFLRFNERPIEYSFVFRRLGEI